MTKKQMEELAELIFQKLLTRQAEFDQQFIQQMKDSGQEFSIEVNNMPTPESTSDEKRDDTERSDNIRYKQELTEELVVLRSILDKALKDERFEACVEITNKINEIKDKLKEL